MDILHQLIAIVLLAVTSRSSPPTHQCVEDCLGVPNGKYHSCQSCHFYVSCNYGILSTHECPSSKQWDARRKDCRGGKSKTCPLEDEIKSGEKTSAMPETASIYNENSGSLVRTTEVNVSMQSLEYFDFSTSIFLEKYIIPIAIGIGAFMIATYIFCILWKYNWCRKQKRLEVQIPVVSVASQTSTAEDCSEYEELHYIPQRPRLPPPVHYMPMPYAVSNVHRYQELSVPYSERPTGPNHSYLEILAYPYLQIPDENAREKVNDMVIPIVEALCTDNKDTERYVSFENKLKILAEELKEKD